MLGNDKAWPMCCPESRPEVWSRDIHKCTSGKPKSSVWFLFQEELCYSALRLIPKGPKCISESINLIMNYPLGMWQGQFNTLSLLPVQKQIQYRRGHKAQDSENITKHWEALAARMEGSNMQE